MSRYDLDGLDEFEKSLIRTIESKYPKEAKKFMRRQLNHLKKNVVADTPRDKGNLQKGWKVSVKGRKGKVEAHIKNSMPHTHLIENGHETVDGGWWEGKHMLEKNVESKKKDFEDAVNTFLDDALGELKL